LVGVFPQLFLQKNSEINMKLQIAKASFLSLILTAFIGIISTQAQDGKALFQEKCASCHNPYKEGTGPALYGALTRNGGDKELLKAWIKNNSEVIASGNAYYNKVKDYAASQMQLFTTLKPAELDALADWIEKIPPPPVKGAAGSAGPSESEGDSTLMYGILTLVLSIVALILLGVNNNLKKLSDDKLGVPSKEPIPFYKNRTYFQILAVIAALVGGYLTTKGAIGYGRHKNYQPVQPIYYSHKVHAGVNQINCLYCHSGAEQGKHANIPSVNVCMNCHKGINEYGGDPIVSEDGTEVNGSEEILKLYRYAGVTKDEAKNWSVSNDANMKPIEWIRIHNLPDHVYFNHAQHVKAGKVQCQTCHGPIQEMHEVKQFSDLSMGWCINCHRETEVKFKDNGFYQTYEKWHTDAKARMDRDYQAQLKANKGDKSKVKLDSASYFKVTVENIGGTECQKCHY
jgi:mono/diheme cytochrome c family protein